MAEQLRRAVTGIGLALIGASAAADELVLRAYIGLPLGAGETFLGLRADLERPLDDAVGAEPALSDPAHVDLRFSGRTNSTFSINGVAVDKTMLRYAGDSAATDTAPDSAGGVDWYSVAGVAVGVGLIAAIIAADDVSIKACSGVPCPPDPQPPPEPEPADADAGT